MASALDLPTRPAHDCKVLVVDDDPGIAEIISTFLKKDGYKILTAENGRRALEVIEDEKPDVVVLDVFMPEMDGIETCRRIKSNPATHFLPVVMVTAKADMENRIAGKEAGTDDFLDKPVNELELLTRVRVLVRNKQLHDQVEDERRKLDQRVRERTAELRDAYERLKDAEQVRSNILAGVSHELCTPLLHIKSAVALLSSEALSPDEVKSTLDSANRGVLALERRIDDLLAFASGCKGLELDVVNVPDAIRAAIEQLRGVYGPKMAEVSVEIAGNLPPVKADARGLTRVLFHLIDNGIKFGEGKPVTVTARTESADGVRISVQDQGPGIPPDQLERALEPFRRGDESSTRKHSGVGLGIPLSKSIVEWHGAEFHLESKPGQGTTVWFVLPAVEMNAIERPPQGDKPA
jgi:two-component system sensor histidine kinase/response regulator